MADQRDMPLFSSVMVLFLGILFQLANLNVMGYGDIVRLWPLLLIAVGIRVVLKNFRKQEREDEQK